MAWGARARGRGTRRSAEAIFPCLHLYIQADRLGTRGQRVPRARTEERAHPFLRYLGALPPVHLVDDFFDNFFIPANSDYLVYLWPKNSRFPNSRFQQQSRRSNRKVHCATGPCPQSHSALRKCVFKKCSLQQSSAFLCKLPLCHWAASPAAAYRQTNPASQPASLPAMQPAKTIIVLHEFVQMKVRHLSAASKTLCIYSTLNLP